MTGETVDLRDWVGRREIAEDRASGGPVAGLAATLDLAPPDLGPGAQVPPGWHWLYFLPRVPRSGLGADGHPARGGFMPPVTLPRRMFAGARLTFERPIPIGSTLRRESEVTDVTEKSGKAGRLVFVAVRHRVLADGQLALIEEQTIVYREATAPAPRPEPDRAEVGTGDWRRRVVPDPVMLFRFSALTFNSHRIHYDRPYAIEEEGYPGLVVHGPLTALLLLQLCRDGTGGRPAAEFAFRARRPLFDTAPFDLVGRPDADGAGCTLEALGPDLSVAMTASVRFADR